MSFWLREKRAGYFEVPLSEVGSKARYATTPLMLFTLRGASTWYGDIGSTLSIDTGNIIGAPTIGSSDPPLQEVQKRVNAPLLPGAPVSQDLGDLDVITISKGIIKRDIVWNDEQDGNAKVSNELEMEQGPPPSPELEETGGEVADTITSGLQEILEKLQKNKKR